MTKTPLAVYYAAIEEINFNLGIEINNI